MESNTFSFALHRTSDAQVLLEKAVKAVRVQCRTLNEETSPVRYRMVARIEEKLLEAQGMIDNAIEALGNEVEREASAHAL